MVQRDARSPPRTPLRRFRGISKFCCRAESPAAKREGLVRKPTIQRCLEQAFHAAAAARHTGTGSSGPSASDTCFPEWMLRSCPSWGGGPCCTSSWTSRAPWEHRRPPPPARRRPDPIAAAASPLLSRTQLLADAYGTDAACQLTQQLLSLRLGQQQQQQQPSVDDDMTFGALTLQACFA